MGRSHVGLLPLYLELYDRVRASARERMEAFYTLIGKELENRGMEVLRVPVARTRAEFRRAVRSFEARSADAIVTLHLAYSPSLESADVLASTRLPLVVLDTTPAESFAPDADPEEIMFNHGIHGVQDLCNLLMRRGKSYSIEAGHWRESDVLDRTAARVRGAAMASRMRSSRVGLIGRPFRGMGDFAVPRRRLARRIGLKTVPLSSQKLRSLLAGVTAQSIQTAKDENAGRFAVADMSPEAYDRSLRLSLAVENWVDAEELTAWSFNFLAVTRAAGFPTVPFLAASRLMARGIGYAGEGDVLTAALVGSLASIYPETGFTEMFCPDWKGGAVFLSHMGEMNPELAAGKAELHEMDYEFSDTDAPVVLSGCFREGRVLLVDLAPLPQRRFRLICSPATMLGAKGSDRMKTHVRGWLKPDLRLPDFLEAYSRAGGTHHLAVVYGADARAIHTFADAMGWESCFLGGLVPPGYFSR